MKVHELIAKLQQLPQDADVMTKKTDVVGNIGNVYSVQESTYGFFGASVPCVILTDEFLDEEDEDE